jgi:cytochrome P450 family 142 subfamily A polypeptide 1
LCAVVDLLDGELYAGDPEPTYAWLRTHEPVHWDDINGLWGISRYHDIVSVEKQPRRYSSRNAFRPLPPPDHDDLSMIAQDDPRHQAQRSLVSRRFTPRAAGGHEAWIRRIVTGLLDDVSAHGGEVDAVETLAAPLPAIVIAELLGFGVDRWREVKDWSERTIPLGGGPRSLNEDGMSAAFEFAAECAALITERRREPRDDLVSHWIASEVEGRPMTDDEIIAECLLLVDGGAETTRTVIAQTIWDLAERPDQLRLLREDPSLLRTTAVEEFIRWVTPILNMARVVTEDHELHGRQLRAGQQVLLMYSSANRDPEVFDEPGRYDVTRTHNHHVAFGFGTHFCLGASLARLEIRVLFEELIGRYGTFELIDGDPPRRIPGAFVRGVERVPVRFR